MRRYVPVLLAGLEFRVALVSRGAPLKHRARAVDKVTMIENIFDQGVPVALMAALVVSLWIAGIWTLVKDERGPAVMFTRVLIVGFVAFLAWRFAVPLFV